MQASRSRHPFTFQHQQRRPGSDWLPDAMTDTTAKRRRGARRLFGDGEGVICRLLVIPDRQLHHAVVALPPDADFYLGAPALAKAELEWLFGPAPRYVKVARGRTGVHHAHVLVMLPEPLNLPSAGHYGSLYLNKVQDDRHLQNLAEYFSRPSDERACRSKPEDLPRYSLKELQEQRLDASELYLAARRAAQGQGERLPRRSWTSNLPTINSPRRNTEVACRAYPWRSSTPAMPHRPRGCRESMRRATSSQAQLPQPDSLPLPLNPAPRRLSTGVNARAPPLPSGRPDSHHSSFPPLCRLFQSW